MNVNNGAGEKLGNTKRTLKRLPTYKERQAELELAKRPFNKVELPNVLTVYLFNILEGDEVYPKYTIKDFLTTHFARDVNISPSVATESIRKDRRKGYVETYKTIPTRKRPNEMTITPKGRKHVSVLEHTDPTLIGNIITILKRDKTEDIFEQHREISSMASDFPSVIEQPAELTIDQGTTLRGLYLTLEQLREVREEGLRLSDPDAADEAGLFRQD